MTDLTNPASIMASASQRAAELGMDPITFAQSMGYESLDDLARGATVNYGLAGGPSKPDMTKFGLQQGQNILGAAADQGASPVESAGAGPAGYSGEYGIVPEGYMLDEVGYSSELNLYNEQLRQYAEQVAELEKFEALQAQYQGKLDQYYQQQSKYGTAAAMRAKQAGLYSQIGELIGENEYYKRPINLTGVQSEFV
jgi:hypothetical protein